MSQGLEYKDTFPPTSWNLVECWIKETMNSLEPSTGNSQESQLPRYVITCRKIENTVIYEWMKQKLWLLFELSPKQCSFIPLARIWGTVFTLLLPDFGSWLNLPGIYTSALVWQFKTDSYFYPVPLTWVYNTGNIGWRTVMKAHRTLWSVRMS